MPPVELIEHSDAVLRRETSCMPPALSRRPLPPVIVTEKGESLAEFIARKAPDNVTCLQVRLVATGAHVTAGRCLGVRQAARGYRGANHRRGQDERLTVLPVCTAALQQLLCSSRSGAVLSHVAACESASVVDSGEQTLTCSCRG
jgi:hypothetical protein